MPSSSSLLLFTIILFLIAASIAAFPTQEFSDCDPLVPQNCLLPFPNNFWLRNDASTITGKRVKFGNTSLPLSNPYKQHIIPDDYNRLDGFAIIPAITAYFANVEFDEDIPRHWNESVSLSPNCKTIILRADTLELVPHFAELDYTTDVTATRAFMMWPLQSLEWNTRYIVAMRNLVNTTGSVIEPSEAFQALRDNIPTTNYDIEGRRALYVDIFNLLSKVGVSRSELTLAWDFNTASKESATHDLVYMRDDATARLPVGGPDYSITQVDDEFSSTIQRRILGTFQMPLYMTTPNPGAYLVRDENGTPVFQGYTPVPFEVLIPRSLANGTFSSGRILQYGHGLFGDKSEVEVDYLTDEANRNGWVLGAVDWWGMSDMDEPAVVNMLAANLSNFIIVPDRSKQGMTNALMMMKLLRGKFSQDAKVVYNGHSVLDITKVSYFGNSQGGILGNVYMSLSQDVLRGCLGVAGGPYGLLLPRSADFVDLFDILKVRLSDSIDRIMLISIYQMLWDSAEPAGFVSSITGNTLPDTPAKTVLYHYGLGDAQVNYLGTYTLARTVGAQMFVNNVRENGESLFGFTFITGPTNSSILQGFDFGAPAEPPNNTPPDKKTDTHELPRRDPRAQAQMYEFFETGVISDHCGGAGCYPL